MAVAHYNVRDGDAAADVFEKLLAVDPYRLDDIDVYSNVLYVQVRGDFLNAVGFLADRTVFVLSATQCLLGLIYQCSVSPSQYCTASDSPWSVCCRTSELS